VGERGAAVFAKWARADVILTERRIQEEILPALPVTVPRYYGTCLDGGDGWLFLEDVGDARYSRFDPDHLRVAGEWVATLHVAAARSGRPPGLPDAGPARYLRHLRNARARVHACLGRWRLAPGEVEVLTALLAWLEALEARWALVEAGCAGAPATLVHGDFQPKNAFLRSNGHGLQLFAIDWEMAGWGPPPADLTRIDLAAYWCVVRESWPDVDFATVERLARLGRVLEGIASADWKCASLELDRADHRSAAVSDLALVVSRLGEAARAADVAE
jgi:aminoglycoside phosphotransferase (APT) family kinase protein